MTATKCTTGPWQFIAASDWFPWPGAIEIVGPEGKSIAWTTSGANERHDAPMLAAAPDLYVALEAMLDHYGPPSSIAAFCEFPEGHPITLSRRALAKARGEQS